MVLHSLLADKHYPCNGWNIHKLRDEKPSIIDLLFHIPAKDWIRGNFRKCLQGSFAGCFEEGKEGRLAGLAQESTHFGLGFECKIST